tara:strand:+ start:4490 stop:5650 length:1161 start_codon:yes stop_codon:yes gene_type:complete
MNLGQMHISVQHGVDKINSMHSDLLLPEEIDLELNKNIQRFINQRWNAGGNKYRQGFEMSQKRIDDLRTLIKEFSSPTVYKGHVFKKTFIDATFLPSDYLHLINLKSLIYNYKCKAFDYNIDIIAVGKQTIEIEFDHTVINIAGYTTYIGAYLSHDTAGNIPVTLPPQTALTVPYSGADNLTAFKTWITDPANWTQDVHSITYTGSVATVILNVGVPTFGGSTVLEITPPAIGLATSLTLGLVTTNTASGFGRNFIYSNKRINGTDSNGDPLSYVSDVSMNKFIQHDDIFKILSDPFNKTKVSSPIYTIKDDHVEVYTDDTFIVDAIKMTYLKKPVVIDIINSPSVNCDLPDYTHQEIVDMTVNSILEAISDPRYQSTSIEMLKSE